MKNKKAFTLVEIMIVVAIIGVLAMIAIPAYLRARENSRRSACINNLRLIEDAKEQYAMEYGRRNGDPVNSTDPSDEAAFAVLVGAVTGYIKDFPLCPTGDPSRTRKALHSSDDYGVEAIGANPFCRLMGDDDDFTHELPDSLFPGDGDEDEPETTEVPETTMPGG